jgi:hypothetical protein
MVETETVSSEAEYAVHQRMYRRFVQGVGLFAASVLLIMLLLYLLVG